MVGVNGSNCLELLVGCVFFLLVILTLYISKVGGVNFAPFQIGLGFARYYVFNRCQG